ncbi:MAG: hypothetical protein Q9191_006645 [Dirinaria sp. TL-2023a]
MEETSVACETELPRALKRRKVRKGTQSCWECKRRKIRCTFAAPTGSSCDGCRSRGLSCVSQAFDNEPEPANRSVVNRLCRVEELVEQLAQRAGTDLSSSLSQGSQDARIEAGEQGEKDSPYAFQNLNSRQSELDLMTSVTIGISVPFHGTVCMPYSRFLSKDMPSPREMLQLPPRGSHPVFIARKLLMLGSFLQSIPPGAVKDLGRLSTKYREVMSRVVEAASRLVTSDNDLVSSLEGIECVMIESMYQNNAGNLRHAWLINRRAMLIAQSLGLHLVKSQLSNMLDVNTRGRIDPEYMWLRLVTSDRYLSLMLGLPQGSPESPFATPKALERCTGIERMERIEAMVGGLILERNREDLHNLEATYEIDKLLQDAAASMPAQWWLTPDVATIAGFDANAFTETIRIINQFVHYHLLAQLHLPYLLQSSATSKYDYSKITALNASREILLRFVSFSDSKMVAAYCRGIDFLAFIAITTLCLAQIDFGRQHGIRMGNCATVFHFLVHQRLADRGLMERTLHSMEKMAKNDNDAIACKISSVLRSLLAIEAAAAEGGSYNATFSSEHREQEILCGGNRHNDNDPLCITIPCFGTIKIEHDSVVRYAEVPHKNCGENAEPNLAAKTSRSGPGLCFESDAVSNVAGQRSSWEASPSATRSSVCQISGQPGYTSWQAAQSRIGSVEPAQGSEALANDKEVFSLDRDSFEAEGLLASGQAPDVDDWALQGVDMTLFSSLFQ